MPDVSFSGLVILSAVAFAAPLLLGLFPPVRLPAVVLEIVLLIAIMLVATSLGLVVPVLKDAGEVATEFGQLVVAAGTIADFGAVILLSLFFSGESGGVGSKLILLGGFVLVLAVVGLSVAGA